MEFKKLIQSRRSVRRFNGQSVEKEKIDSILQAVSIAPSAGNLQAYKVLVLEEEAMKQQLAKTALGQDFVAKASFVLLFCADTEASARGYGQRGRELYCLQDADIACTYAMLAATDVGLGCCWVGAFDEEEVEEALGLAPALRPVSMLAVGYAAESPLPSSRRDVGEIAALVEER